jgi:DNA-binding beta-propeller fold protein YncE
MACAAAAQTFAPVDGWLELPDTRETLGNMHGDVAVSAAGDVYVSVQDPEAGVQVFAPDGHFLRVLPNAPSDFHGFVIRDRGDGEHLYGATMRGQTILKLTLDGEIVLEIPAAAIPAEYKTENRFIEGIGVLLTGLDVAPNGDLYVADGYSSDFIHRFDAAGRYVESFGGKGAPYGFDTLHKLAIDERFDPPRIIATDRANNRVVHLALDGEFLGVVAEGLKLPAAVTISGEHAIVGELQGRVSILDKQGRVVGTVGENAEEGIGTNQVPPEQWRAGFVISPHGVATNAEGDLFVAEFNTFGRVHKFDRR